MNIAFLHRRYDRTGGTERDLYELVGQVLQFGHEVHLYCGEYRVPPQEGAVAHRVPYLRAGEMAKLLSFASLAPKAAGSGRHDVVISFSKVFRQDIIRCGGGTHRQFLQNIEQVRGPFSNTLKWPKDRAALYIEQRQFQKDNYRRIIAVSKMVKKELIHLYQVPEDKIDVIYDGVDAKLFSPDNQHLYRSSMRKKYGIHENSYLLLFVGSGFVRKGLEFLLRALGELKSADVKLLVVGADSNQDKFRGLASRLGVADNIVFAGLQKDVQRFYAAADVVVLPSVQEAFGNVVLEALASGLPVITTKNAGASEILKGRLRDYILDRHDNVREMARMIRELSDSRTRADLSTEARAIAGGFTFEANARAFEAACELFIREKAAAKQ
jgi:UDP-glucose:(heptosyl)LPS alpha-1,3-glucosyltransferase